MSPSVLTEKIWITHKLKYLPGFFPTWKSNFHEKTENKLCLKSYPFIKNLCHYTRWICEVFNPRNWPVDGSINESFNKWLTTHACVVVELADLNVTYKIPLLHVLNSNTTLNQKKHSINWLSKQTVSHSSPSANFPLRQSKATFPR